MKLILIIEDDPSIIQLLRLTFKHSGYRTVNADSVSKASIIIKEEAVDFAVIDIGLKDGLGYELVSKMKDAHIPFIFLTARGHLTEKLYGIELGADDYMVKPFEPLELVARVKMILRRVADDKPKVRVFGDLRVCIDSRMVTMGGQNLSLSPKEFDLLDVLSASPGTSFTREALMEKVWGYDVYSTTRTVDTHILTLRQKIGASRIRTIYKIGYAFDGDAI